MLTEHDVEALMSARHVDPFGVLGMHVQDGALWVNALVPGAQHVEVLDRGKGGVVAALVRIGSSDVFSARMGRRRKPFDYVLRLVGPDASMAQVREDPFRFGLVLEHTDVWLLAEGRHLRPYACLGAHPGVWSGSDGTRFAVWAPNARRVSVVGDFNAWDGRVHPMRLRRECGVWEIFVPGVGRGALYKFEILTHGDERLLKSDPYAFRAELRPATASIVHGLVAVPAVDSGRAHRNAQDRPMCIYEVHLGSWRRIDGWRWLGYRELANTLVPYVRDQGFTHLELLPVSEHPFDGSWGYQPLGLFAPTARHGTPEDFQYLVEAAPAAGLGVIVDWVPAHFPSDAHGLARFDGTCLYEHADVREGLHPDWNTLIYNFGRAEVSNFLCANAMFWLERFGVDGLRVDAVASMLYRDYSRRDGEWIPNRHGGRENLEAVAFLRRLNHVIGVECPGAVTIAEESTAFPGVTRPPSDDLQGGGLGFHYKWNMGWMHDTLAYMSRAPVYRRHHHNDMTFGMIYAFHEHFILALSHDEVVHGKGSLLRRMPGDDWQRFANLRTYFGFMYGHPGKKLVFMGGEFGQEHEWRADGELDWFLLENPLHAGVQRLVRDLNRVCTAHAALYRLDAQDRGFEWIVGDDAGNSVFAFLRLADAEDGVIVLCNMTPVPRDGYRIGVPPARAWEVLINTDDPVYGGSAYPLDAGEIEARAWNGREHSMRINLPPLACVMLKASRESSGPDAALPGGRSI